MKNELFWRIDVMAMVGKKMSFGQLDHTIFEFIKIVRTRRVSIIEYRLSGTGWLVYGGRGRAVHPCVCVGAF